MVEEGVEIGGGADRGGAGGGGQVPGRGRRHGGHEGHLPVPGGQRLVLEAEQRIVFIPFYIF